jgi:hypothetical protein
VVSGELLVRVDLALKERFAGAAARASSAAADAAEGGGSLQPAASSPRAAPAMQARAPLTRAPHARGLMRVGGAGVQSPRQRVQGVRRVQAALPSLARGDAAGEDHVWSGTVRSLSPLRPPAPSAPPPRRS